MDNKRDIVFWILAVIVLAMCIYFVFFIRSESYQCMSSPLIYGVQQYKSSEGKFMCTCSSGFAESILVTSEGISSLESYDTLFTTE